MEELHHLDEVAYVRFASVYRSFQDVDAFREEIERMRHRRSREAAEGQLALWSGEAGKKSEVRDECRCGPKLCDTKRSALHVTLSTRSHVLPLDVA